MIRSSRGNRSRRKIKRRGKTATATAAATTRRNSFIWPKS